MDTSGPDELVVVPDDAIWEITLRIHDSRSGRLVGQNVHRGSDLSALVDEASVQLKRDIGLPSRHIETARDLPVAEMVTHEMPALALFAKGLDLALFQRDWVGGLDALERSVEYDSTFAYAHCVLFEFYNATNMPAERDAALKTTMRHIYKLPERVQFVVKYEHYTFAQEPEKMLRVIELWSELYPDDVEARVLLARLMRERGDRDAAIAEFERIMEIDPSRTEFLNAIAWQYREKGEFATAISCYETYAREHPDDAEVYHMMGTTYEVQGEYEKAREYYEKSLVIDPNRPRVLTDLGDIHGKLSEDEKAVETYQRALEMSKTPQDRARVYGSTKNFYSNRGQMEKSLGEMRLMWAEEERFLTPVGAQLTRLDEICQFVVGGREKQAFDEVESMRAQMAPPYDRILPLAYMCIYIELDDADKTEEEVEALEAFIDTYQLESERGSVYWGRGKVAELRGDYEAAIEFYRKNLELNPSRVTMHRAIGRCYRKLGWNEEALASLEKMLKIYPGNPTANYQAALAHRAMGNEQAAMECLQKALDRWKDADPVYKPAREARATLAEWGS
jgi:tetratricopeptide (TPR) repeat protein